MDTVYFPPKQRGIFFHLIVVMILLTGSGYGFLQANRVEFGRPFMVSMMIFFLFVLPIPLVVYRMYALTQAYYALSPERIRLRWGIRTEEIPMEHILWLSPIEHLESALPQPWLRWPGAVVGTRRVGTGEVEYLASRSNELLIIATPGKMYAISPENRDTFIQTFHRQAEIGTLTPATGYSIYPTFLLGNVWANLPARMTLFVGFLLSLLLLVWITFIAEPDRTLYITNHEILRPLTVTQLLLIPIINSIYYLFNLLLGLFLYRRDESRPLAFLLWSGNILTSILFFIALYNVVLPS